MIPKLTNISQFFSMRRPLGERYMCSKSLYILLSAKSNICSEQTQRFVSVALCENQSLVHSSVTSSNGRERWAGMIRRKKLEMKIKTSRTWMMIYTDLQVRFAFVIQLECITNPTFCFTHISLAEINNVESAMHL